MRYRMPAIDIDKQNLTILNRKWHQFYNYHGKYMDNVCEVSDKAYKHTQFLYNRPIFLKLLGVRLLQVRAVRPQK